MTPCRERRHLNGNRLVLKAGLIAFCCQMMLPTTIAQSQPSLKETTDWLVGKLANKRVSVVPRVEDYNPTWATTDAGADSLFSADHCTMTLFWGVKKNEIAIHKPNEVALEATLVQLGLLGSPTIRLFKGKGLDNRPVEEWAVVLSRRSDTSPIRSRYWDFSSQTSETETEYNDTALLIWMPDKALSERVRNAFEHAVASCRATLKPEPF